MRIGLVIYGSLGTLSGGYLYDRKLVEYLRSRGDTVEIISQRWGPYPLRLAQGLDSGLASRLAGLNLDVLLEDELNHPSLIAANLRLKRLGHAPILSIVHHLRSSEAHPPAWMPLYRAVERAYLRSADGFIFNSRATHAAVEALLGAQPGLSVTATPGGDRFGAALDEGEIRRRTQAAGPLRVLFVGNVIARKGLETLLRAAAELPEGSACLRIAGRMDAEPATTRSLKRFINRCKIGGRIAFLGALDDEGLAAEMRIANVLAVPSQYEGFGIVYLEGMGFGLPALGTTAGAASEIIHDGVSGKLVAPGDWQSLAGWLRQLSGERSLLLNLSLAARRRFDAFPGWDASMENARSFLHKLG